MTERSTLLSICGMHSQSHPVNDALFVRLRRALHSPRHRLLLLLAVLLLGGLVVTHHIEPKGMDGMAGGICLAILGGVALLAAPARLRRPGRPRPSRSRPPRQLPLIVLLAGPRPRAGPLYLELSVLRT